MSNLHLDVDAQVVRQLGEELITDAEQALLELVKNSYDADASWCNVIIDSKFSSKDNSFEEIGKIVVQDDGLGMSYEDIQRGWLTISLSPKREMKLKGKTTKKYDRTPLGDKGLGRLGTMKLGNRLEIFTHHNIKDKGYRVTFQWNDCMSGKPLSDVPVHVEKVPSIGKTGTTITINGLSEPSYWRGEKRKKDLRLKLSTLISPFKSFNNFTIAVESDDKKLDLISFPKKLFNTASTYFDAIWDDKHLEINGRIKTDILKGKDIEFYNSYVVPDSGNRFFQYINNNKVKKKLSLKKSNNSSWFIEFSDKISWNDIPLTKLNSERIEKPGCFLAEIYSFALKLGKDEIPDIASRLSDYKRYIKQMANILIFRDNFRIRMGQDWLKLGEAWTSGGSYYGLRPINTVGYFSITAKDNPKLEEKSDREGFIDNAAWNGFYLIAERIKKFANDSLEDIRRTFVDFRKEIKNKESEIPETFSAEQSANEIAELVKSSSKIGKKIKTDSKKQLKDFSSASKQIDSLLSNKKRYSKIEKELLNTKLQIDKIISQYQDSINEINDIMMKLSNKERSVEIIVERFEQFNEQLNDVYETVGIGLAAQGLVHEVHPFIDDVVGRIKRIKSTLKPFRMQAAAIMGDLEGIKSQATIVGKKMAIIDPMLPTFKEKLDIIYLRSFLRDFFALREDRLRKFNIDVDIDYDPENDIYLKINRGRLTQVIENLTKNSEYWLRQYLREKNDKVACIDVKISKPYLYFSDTGYGIRPAMEEVIFDLFTTDKPQGEGHGLGLFIVTQLLEGEGCTIKLDNKKNKYNRKYKFVIDFTGCLHEQ